MMRIVETLWDLFRLYPRSEDGMDGKIFALRSLLSRVLVDILRVSREMK